jgi:hypothetical protein
MAVGHPWYNRVSEITIPQIRSVASIASLDRATYVQQAGDVTQGRLTQLGPGTVNIGGLLPVGADLIVSGYVYYDGNGTASLSHFRTKMDFTQTNALVGPFQVGNTPARAGWVGGYMAPIPAEWQPLLGGDSLTGQCCIPIISRSSLGPSVTVFNAADVGQVNPIPGTRVLGYAATNATLGQWDSTGKLFNGTTAVGGVILPNGTRSVLFAVRRGLGTFCYGEGTSNNPPGIDPYGLPQCYDPSDSSKGNHAYPYESLIYAYDVADLVAAKQGAKQIWQVVPYATWPVNVPFATTARILSGIAYDPSTQRVFIAATMADSGLPLIHVFNLTNGSTGLCR